MESNAMSGPGIYANVHQPNNMLGLEMSLHHPLPPPQNPPNPHLMPPHPHHPMAAFAAAHHDGDCHQPPQPPKQTFPSSSKSKNQTLTLSDDDEPGFATENSADDGKRKTSPWQRMKWTDNMVRLLIMVVYYIGDEAGSDQGTSNDPSTKKKGGGGGGVLQKKGKWKSVSRAMMERGFYVSPQQCEDKFNDLNKRYKRVNDILGKGTSCRVVENQSLLDTMDHLSSKMKDEVRKLLNSKHLFFREMCAYHNSCGHGGGGVAPPEVVAEPPRDHGNCLHSTESVPNMMMPNLNRGGSERSKLGKGTSDEDEDDDDDDDVSSDDDVDGDDEDEDDDDEVIGGSRIHDRGNDHDQINGSDERSKRPRQETTTTITGLNSSQLVQELKAEMMNVLQDGSKGSTEKRMWMKTKLMKLEEQRVGIQYQSYEIEKQRLKWLKFSSKKEREMEREKLTNERLKLENERMVLLLRQKELDLIDHHQQQHSSNKRGDPSSITG